MRHRVWIMNPAAPLRKIRQVECEIVTCEKTTWAERIVLRDVNGVAPRGRRHLLGTSAFYTVKAAERAKRGALQKLVDAGPHGYYGAAQRWDAARTQLKNFAANGTFH